MLYSRTVYCLACVCTHSPSLSQRTPAGHGSQLSPSPLVGPYVPMGQTRLLVVPRGQKLPSGHISPVFLSAGLAVKAPPLQMKPASQGSLSPEVPQ